MEDIGNILSSLAPNVNKDEEPTNIEEPIITDYNLSTDPPTEGAVVKGAIPNGVILSIVGCLGVLGNASLLVLIIMYPNLRTIPNLLIINLTIGDLLYISVSFPVFVLHELYPYWYGNLLTCKSTNYLQIAGLGVCVYSIMGLSMERYIAIVKGLEMRSSRTTVRAVMCIAAIWTVSLIIPIPILIMADKRGPTLCLYIPHWDTPSKAYETCRFVLMYMIPFCTILVLYSLIAKQLLFSPGESSTQNPLFRARRRLAITVMVVAIFFGISWLPYFSYKMWFEYKFLDYFNTPGGEPPYWADYFRAAHNYMAFINPCLNPWILFFISTAHRRSLARCLCCRSSDKDEETSWRMTNLQRGSTRRTQASVITNDTWSKDNKKLSESMA